ncbi:MAG: hypothetical protein JWO96_458 [Candidatus Saccharibacteria bacterium]|nr:hypothetical protein [Candidatus Saccharibacteria bacterium]
MTNGLLIAMVALLVLIVILFGRALRGGLISDIERAIRRLGDAAAHHAEVNAVLALTKSFKDDPTLAQKLAGYSQQVFGAGLLHKVNSLGNDLKKVQVQLSHQRDDAARHAAYPLLLKSRQDAIKQLETLESHLLVELEAANSAVQALGRLRHVS